MIGWILYDVASSGYILMIPGVAYAVYFRQVVCGAAPGCDALWGLLVALALGTAGLLAPVLGAIADLGAIRHRLFMATTLLCCTATAGLFLVQPGAIVLGGVCFVLAQLGYMLSAGLYDSYLPKLVAPPYLGRLSGWGWGLGYLGGIFCFLVTMPLINPGLVADNLVRFRLSFLIVGGFYLVMALPALCWLPRHPSASVSWSQLRPLIQQSYSQVSGTLKGWRQNVNTFRFLVGYYLISDVIVTLNSFIGIYFTAVFGLSISQILRLSLLFNLVSIVATVGLGNLSDRFAGKHLLGLMLVIWVGLIVIMAVSTNPQTPILVAVLTGVVVGPTQSLCRGWFAAMISTDQAGEMFGFHALVSRVSAIIGPLLFGVISSTTGSQRLAVSSLLLLIGGGSLVLSRVRFSR